MTTKKKKPTPKKKIVPMKLTKDQLKKVAGGHELCDASSKGSAHDCGPSSIRNAY